MKTHSTIKRLTLTSLCIAFTYIFTAFIKIPLFGGSGYFNLGDIFILLSSIYLGPINSLLVAIISSVMADLTVGAASFIPFTIIAKGGEAIIAALLFKKMPDKFGLFSLVLGALFIVPVYLFSYYIYYGLGYLINSIFDLIQALSCASLCYALYQTLEKLKINKYIKIT